MYIPKNRPPKYIKWKWIGLKGETNKSIIVIGAFKIPHPVSRHKTSKTTEDMSNTII